MNITFRDDFTSPDGREEGISGALLPGHNGYRRAVLTETTREQLESTFSKLIDAVRKDYQKIDEKRKLNLDAHEGISAKGEAITIPVVKRDSNQQLAWLLDTLFSKDPFITVKPLEAGHVQIIAQDENGQTILDTVTTEEEASAIEDLVNFYTDHKIGLKRTVRTFVTELLRDGNRPPILKVLHEPREIEVGSVALTMAPGSKTVIERIEKDPEFRKVKDGEPTRIEVIPGEKFFIPLPYWDLQSAPFVFQEFEEDTVTLKDKIARGVYDFCSEEEPDMDVVDAVLAGLQTPDEAKKARQDGRVPMEPMRQHVLEEIWFDYPFAQLVGGEIDELTGEETPQSVSVTLIPFCVVRHKESKRFLNCYENFYWHRRRPFHVGKMQERPFSFSAYSTSENVGPFQRLISQLFQLQIQNMVQQNVKVFLVRKTSSTFRFLGNRTNKLRPGLVIPFDEEGDVSSQQLGSPIASMAAEISFLNSESEKMSVVTEYDRGSIPNRTPVGTVNAIEQLAKMQPGMVLDFIRETLADTVKMFVQTLIQFSPEGISIPFRDPQKTGILQKVINFPRELIVDQFAFAITATAADETPQALSTRDLMLSGEITKFNNEAMSIAAAVWVPGVPPSYVNVATKFILGKRRITARLLEHAKLNPDDYMPTDKEIENVPIELLQLQQMMQQQQIGGMNGVPATGPGGSLPEGGGGGIGPGAMEAQPNDASGAAGGLPTGF